MLWTKLNMFCRYDCEVVLSLSIGNRARSRGRTRKWSNELLWPQTRQMRSMHSTSLWRDDFGRMKPWTSFCQLHRLARLVGKPLPERWITCAFVSGLPQRVRQPLLTLSMLETITIEQLLTLAWAVMTDNKGRGIHHCSRASEPEQY